ncbi:TetR/AcrR family transcriptional regulator [Sphingopyxis indica]|uniref:Transcriptional regulator, TetR family n=1 Tax=Sphingopyxis indica TaxID=436663 RepID=A0A239IWK8_9SPHN|nr:TetR/AcrR family transcriptional regulator [Sphingopyxis indica]SNS98136.1 transcriptional regulator, TetR family [Sphingopyxis indica]
MNQPSKRDAKGNAPRDRIIDAARRLFGAHGFHGTTTDKLATAASVSVGQIYRLFEDKDDIVLAIVEKNVGDRVGEMREIFAAVERSEISMVEAIRAVARTALKGEDAGLFYEILAGACRNSSVADRLEPMIDVYRDGIQHLAASARPDVGQAELGAYVDIMMACFIGLGHRTAISRCVDIDVTSENAACVLIRALGLSPSI